MDPFSASERRELQDQVLSLLLIGTSDSKEQKGSASGDAADADRTQIAGVHAFNHPPIETASSDALCDQMTALSTRLLAVNASPEAHEDMGALRTRLGAAARDELDWNQLYQEERARQPTNPRDDHRRRERIAAIIKAFVERASLLARIVVEQASLQSPSDWLIQPHATSTSQVRQYSIQGIRLFHFVGKGTHLRSAGKWARLDVKATAAVYDTGLRIIQTPLSAVIHVRGHVIQAVAMAPLQHLVVGSADGRNIQEGAALPAFKQLTRTVARRLHLAPHRVIDAETGAKELDAAADVGFYVGSDGILYMAHLSRLLPPTSPGPHQRMRPELLSLLKQDGTPALNSDVFSRYVARDSDALRAAAEADEMVISKVFNDKLVGKQAKAAASALDGAFADGETPSIASVLHQHGINVRYALQVAALCEQEQARTALIEEQVLRLLRHAVRRLWYELAKSDVHARDLLWCFSVTWFHCDTRDMRGWLTKRGDVFKSWRKRWFIVDESKNDGTVQYFTGDPDATHSEAGVSPVQGTGAMGAAAAAAAASPAPLPEPEKKGQFSVVGAKVSIVEPDAYDRNHCFTVSMPSKERLWVLAADTAEERQQFLRWFCHCGAVAADQKTEREISLPEALRARSDAVTSFKALMQEYVDTELVSMKAADAFPKGLAAVVRRVLSKPSESLMRRFWSACGCPVSQQTSVKDVIRDQNLLPLPEIQTLAVAAPRAETLKEQEQQLQEELSQRKKAGASVTSQANVLIQMLLLYKHWGAVKKDYCLEAGGRVAKELQHDLQPPLLGRERADMLLAVGQFYRHLQLLPDALAAWQERIEVCQRHVSEDQESKSRLAAACNHKAELLHEMGKSAESLALCERALKIATEAFGANHIKLSSIYRNMTQILKDTGQIEAGIRMAEKTLDIQRKTYGSDVHPEVAATLYVQATLFECKQKHVKAISILDRVLEIQRSTLRGDNVAIADTLHTLGMLHSQTGHFDLAMKLLEQAKAVYKRALGNDHIKMGSVLYQLGKIRDNLGQMAEAFLLYEQALQIQKKVLGDNHCSVADILASLGKARHTVNQSEIGIEKLREALVIYRAHNHPIVGDILFVMAGIRLELGELASAKQLFEQAGDTWKETCGPDHEKTKKAYDMVRRCR